MTEKRHQLAWNYLGEEVPTDFPERDFPGFVSHVLDKERNPPAGWVPGTVYWAVSADDEVVGRISLRHEMTEVLLKYGGHIGYIVRPSWRRRGVATEMLRLILETPKCREIGRLLLTCDENNLASEKTIVKNGGVLENILPHEVPGLPAKKRFWIDLA